MKVEILWGLDGKDLVSQCGRFSIKERTLINNPSERRIFLKDETTQKVHVFLRDSDATRVALDILRSESQ